MVSIDFWNTLVDPLEGSDERYNARLNAIREVAEPYGKAEISEEKLGNIFKSVSEHFNKIWLTEHRTPEAKELTRQLLGALGIKAKEDDINKLSELIQHSLLEGPPALAPNAEEVITELSGKHRLIIISDTMYTPGKILRTYLTKRGLSRYFSGYIFSDEMGFSKPDTRAFDKALHIAKALPDKSYHIGDLEHTDIAGAKASGMRAILYTGLGTDTPESTAADHVLSDWRQAGELLL